MALAEGREGALLLGQGAPTNITFGRTSAQRVQDAHARFQDAVLRGNCYCAGNAAAITFGTALTATGVTAHLTNPAGSGVYGVLWRTGVTVITVTTAGSIVYAYNPLGGVVTAVIHGTPGVVQNCKLGLSGVGGKLQFDVAATLPAAPTFLRTLAYGVSTAPTNAGQIVDNVDGSIIITPGTALSVQGITIAGTGLIDFTWEEVLIGS